MRYQRKVLELTNEVTDRRARQAAKAPVLTALQQAIKDVQASFKALTQIGTNLSPDEIRRRIDRLGSAVPWRAKCSRLLRTWRSCLRRKLALRRSTSACDSPTCRSERHLRVESNSSTLSVADGHYEPTGPSAA